MNRVELLSRIPTALKTNQTTLKKIVIEALCVFGIKNKTVEIWFVSEEKIREFNQKYRQIDKPTDVLSFPQSEIAAKHQLLGSIMVSAISVIRKEEKIDDVIKHGLLHLLGFDHETDEPSWDTAAQKIKCEL